MTAFMVFTRCGSSKILISLNLALYFVYMHDVETIRLIWLSSYTAYIVVVVSVLKSKLYINVLRIGLRCFLYTCSYSIYIWSISTMTRISTGQVLITYIHTFLDNSVEKLQYEIDFMDFN